MIAFIKDVLAARLDAKGQAWLAKALESARAPEKINVFLGYYSGAHKLGKQALALTPAEANRLQAMDVEISLDRWGVDEAARTLILLEASRLPSDDFKALTIRTYQQGDSREQESWLRSLALLPDPERFLATAIDACRTNILQVFESIACENPYPKRFFPELNFNQLVLKSLFLGVALARVVGLKERSNAELSRMTNDYAAEREAAGRVVPVDIWLALAPHATPEGMKRLERYLAHENPDHRFWAAVGLGRNRAPGAKEMLTRRLPSEKDSRVARVIQDALAGKDPQ